MSGMIDKRHARYYAFVWPLFWPWLWLNLRRLEAWQRESGRSVLLHVDRFGNLFIRAMADAPAPNRYHYEPPALPAWEHPARLSDLPCELSDGLPAFMHASARNGHLRTGGLASPTPRAPDTS